MSDDGKPKILNYSELMTRVGGREEIATEVLENVEEMFPELIERCREALKASDADALRRAVHTLKGSASTAGAEIVSDRAADLNAHIKQDALSWEQLSERVAELEGEANAVVEHIRAEYLDGR